MRVPVRLLALGVSCVAVCVVAGCGDDEPSGGDKSSVQTIPVAEYRSKADPLCSQAAKAMAKTELPSTFPAELSDFDQGSKAMLAAIEEPYEQLAALAIPEGLQREHEQFAAALTSAVGDVRLLRELVAAGNDDTDALWLPRTSVVSHTGIAMNEAEALGLEACTSLAFKEGDH